MAKKDEQDIRYEDVEHEHLAEVNGPAQAAYMFGVILASTALMILLIAMLGAGGGGGG